MPNYTSKYNLTKPLAEELYDIEVHNSNMDILDEAITKTTYGTDDLTAGESALATGEVYYVYE